MKICRGCGGVDLCQVLDLGNVPAADYFPLVIEPVGPHESSHQLALVLCSNCGLAQLADDDTVADEPRGLEPQALRDQAADAVRRVATAGWLRGTTVREFGSPHGGSWLPLLAEHGFAPAEPASLVVDCFGAMHEPDQREAFRRRAAALGGDGVLLIQFHSLAAIIAHGQWNALRHGHFAYYSLKSLERLLTAVGLRTVEAWEFDLYGGTVLVAAVRSKADISGDSVRRIRDAESAIISPHAIRGFQGMVDVETTALRRWLLAERNAGRRVYAYGAASRAVALFSLARIDRSLIAAVADAAPAKHGRRMPGTDIPIVSPDALCAADPDRVLLTLPDLLPEVSEQLPELSGRWVSAAQFAEADLRTQHHASSIPVNRAQQALSEAVGAGNASAKSTPSVRSERSFELSNALQRRMHDLVPGGAHTYARGPDQYPEFMTPVLTHGSGCRVWDVDGNEYVEYGMGLRSVTLGHGFRPVVEAVSATIAQGVNFSRPTVLEVAAAEDFLSLVPGADMVKFAKNGSDATTAAVRLARAATGRDKVAVCEQPFFSTDDWFIGTTGMNGGIPESHIATTVRFAYNDLDSLSAVLAGQDVACVILEPATATAEPDIGYLQGVRRLCDRFGALLIFDEMITGFRWSAHGAQGVYGVTPDLSCWGKAMANGFPLSALAGKREYMELGGLRTSEDRVFLLSTTHGPEAASLAAFRAVVKVYRNEDPIGQMERAGHLLAGGVGAAVEELGLSDYLQVIGRPSCLVFITRDADSHPSQSYRTLFLQGLLGRGVLGQSFVTSAAHTDADIEHTIAAVRDALPDYRRAIERRSVDGLLVGRPVAPAIRRLAWPRQIDTLSPPG